MARIPLLAMPTASSLITVPAVATASGADDLPLVYTRMRSMGPITFEGIAVTGRVPRLLGLVLLLIIAILPG